MWLEGKMFNVNHLIPERAWAQHTNHHRKQQITKFGISDLLRKPKNNKRYSPEKFIEKMESGYFG